MIGENSLLNGRYRLGKRIGQGGFAQVFLATDELLKRRVAVKVLNSELTEDESFLGRFEREAQSIAGLEHPNILGVYDYGQAEDTAYLVMPFVEGGTLHDLLRRERRLSLPVINNYLQQAAQALDYAARRNIVHRDIKPQNILLRQEDDHLFLADFGIAKVISSASSQSRTGIIGTLSYMAPEQLGGNVGRTTDIYALGCVLFQMLTGQLPFVGPTEQVIYGHLTLPVPSLLERSQGTLPPNLQTVLDKALAKKPEDRYQTAAELAAAFGAAISGKTAVGPEAATLPFDATLPMSPSEARNAPYYVQPGTLEYGGYTPPQAPAQPYNTSPPQYNPPPPQSGTYVPLPAQPPQYQTPQQYNRPPAEARPGGAGAGSGRPPVYYENAPANYNTYPSTPTPQPPRRGGAPLLLGLSALVGLVIVGVVAFVVFSSNTSKPPNPTGVAVVTNTPGGVATSPAGTTPAGLATTVVGPTASDLPTVTSQPITGLPLLTTAPVATTLPPTTAPAVTTVAPTTLAPTTLAPTTAPVVTTPAPTKSPVSVFGNQIAFAAPDDSKHWDIYTVKADGSGQPVKLINREYDVISPSFSPDGQWVAYVLDKDKNHRQIRKVKVDGSSDQELTSIDHRNEYPVWTSNGQQILFISSRNYDAGSGNSDAFVMDSTGKNPQLLFAKSGVVSQASDLLAFVRYNGKSHDLLISEQGKPERPIIADGTECDFPTISPDGSQIAYTHGFNNDRAIYLSDRYGYDNRRVSPAGQVATNPSWSPDGKTLAYVVLNGGDGIWEIYSVDLSNGIGQPRKVFANSKAKFYIAWGR